MTIRTTSVLNSNMPIGVTGGTTVQDIRDIVDTFGARTKCLVDYFVTGDSNPSHDAFVRMVASLQSGDSVYIDAGTHVLMSQITISSLTGLTIRLSRNARIKLTNRAWDGSGDGSRVGIAFHDCTDLTIDGGIWDANGTQNNALNTNSKTGQVSVLAVVSNVATTSETVLSKRINIRNARFVDLFMTGLSLRNTEDAVVENCEFTDPGYTRTRGTTGNEAPYLGLAMAHRTRVRNCSFLGAYNANDAVGSHPGEFSGIIASVGAQSGHIYRTVTDRGRFKGFGYQSALEWTAPSSGTTASPSWSSLLVDSATFTTSEMKFLHLTKNRNNQFDISPGRLACTAIDNTAKTISFSYQNLRGTQTNPVPAFAGQTMVTFGYRPDGMMRDLTVEGCYLKNMGGAGLFCWGVNGYVVRGNTCLDCRDIGLDFEFTVNGVISGNVATSTPGYTVSSGISVLELAHNVAITGNTIRLHAPLYGLNIETGGPIISDVTVSGNMISGGDVRIRGGGQTGAGCNIGYVNIVGNTIDGLGAEGATAYDYNVRIDLTNVCRDIVINGNTLLNAASTPVQFTNVDGITVMNNVINHTQWNGIAQELPVSTVNTSRRVVIQNNYLHDTGQGWRDGYGLLRRDGATSTEAALVYGNTVTTLPANASYVVTPPVLTVADVPTPPKGPSAIQVGTIMLRDNGGVLEKATTADYAADTTGSWSTVVEASSADVLAITGTTYTATLADNRRRITFNNASAITFTIPSSLPVGWECSIIQIGAGQVTISVTGGNLRHPDSHIKTQKQYAQAYLWVYANAGSAPQVGFTGDTSL